MPTDSKPTTPKKGKKGKVEPKVEEEVVEEVEVEEVVEDAEEVVPGQEHSLAFKSLTDRDIRELAECGDAETTIRYVFRLHYMLFLFSFPLLSPSLSLALATPW
eukprot:TRINITY_DN7368_c0_g1_i1.p1 TRINITY_DN7368_c0_g1~~TRINITY_DN7368_c0_g1_i1.p1  ORF type:complete len:104 (-),score=14.71 TRINITY_DN7368_c0_g1_i1:33-344(-)